MFSDKITLRELYQWEGVPAEEIMEAVCQLA